jgi:ribonuclease Z
MPTRQRNHNGYLLLWDDEGVLVDPGEGTQRQLLLSGVRATRITHICLTHLHGDHCLGLPGVLARLAQCQLRGPVSLHFPASGLGYVERLLTSSILDLDLDLRLDPVSEPGVVVDRKRFRLRTERLDHSADAMGWRVEDPSRRHLLPDRLREHAVGGAAVQTLVREGEVRVGDRMVHLDEVSAMGEAHAVAFVFDTRWCDGAVALARDADLLVCESTFLDVDADLARDYRHLTAKQAGELATVAGAHRLVLTHFSGRYPDAGQFLTEAAGEFRDVILAEDLLRIPLVRPPRPGNQG